MARDNRLLGRFNLSEIPSAPRGVPQVEVTFDIDANGILHVSAKDLGTQKEQKITVTSGSGLSESEIKRMVDEAQQHAAEDKSKREVIESKNKLDSLVFQVEKNMTEAGAKIAEDVKAGIETELAAARKVLETQSDNKAALDAAATALEQKAHKLAEEMYKNAGAQAGATTEGPEGTPHAGGAKKDGVVDAEFESN